MCRIGEATVPGPTQSECLIGCLNPTGLLDKASVIANLPKATNGQNGCGRCQKRICQHQEWSNSNASFISIKLECKAQLGAAVPLRSHTPSAIGGKHRGVGFITTAPNRAMTATWPETAWRGRAVFHVACFQIGERWIQGGVIYGHAVHPETLVTPRKRLTPFVPMSLHALVHQSHGLRFIDGDFNQPDGALANMSHWADAGWVNVQFWAQQKLGKPVEATCKQKTTKDHLYVSPQLAMYLKDVEVQHDWFADHSILIARFHPLGNPPLLPLWKRPAAIDWSVLTQADVAAQFEPPAPNADPYQPICQSHATS